MVSNIAVLVVLVGCLLELALASKGPAQDVPRDGRLGFPPGMTVGYAGATTDSTHPPRVMLRCYGAACDGRLGLPPSVAPVSMPSRIFRLAAAELSGGRLDSPIQRYSEYSDCSSIWARCLRTPRAAHGADWVLSWYSRGYSRGALDSGTRRELDGY
jgi:hypothetical protein